MSANDEKSEPLLKGPKQAHMGEADPVGYVCQICKAPLVARSPQSSVVQGSTWQGCPDACFCCSPICCSSWHWQITEQRVDLTHGCCGSSMETLDLRRIIDLHFQRNVWQLCCGRGTIIIHSDNAEFPKLYLTTFGTKEIFERLKQAWTKAKIATAVHHDDHDTHHMHV